MTFPLESSIIQLDEVTIQTATSLTNLIELNEQNTPINLAGADVQVQYSEALALRVQLSDVQTRNSWQVRMCSLLRKHYCARLGFAQVFRCAYAYLLHL